MAQLKNRVKEHLSAKYGKDDIPSQDKLAQIVGLSQTTISRWIANKIDRFDGEALEKWARFFKCRVSDLIYMENEGDWLA